MRLTPTLLLPVVLVAGLAACGGGDDDEAATPASGGGAAGAVTIVDFAFEPETIEATAGEPLTVTNEDSAPHTLTADDDSFDSGELAEGDEAEIVIDEPGTYTVHCEIHEYMTGTVEVR